MDPLTRFNALPEDQRRRILDDHRDWYTEGDWWDTTYEQFRYAMDKIGIYVNQINFSGFWNQGDGASFTGHIDNWSAFLDAHLPSMPPAHRAFILCGDPHLLSGDPQFAMTRHSNYNSNRYKHEFTVAGVFHYDVGNYGDPDTWHELSPYDDPLRTAVWALQMQDFSVDELRVELEDIFRSHMRDLYKALEARYDDLQSDEVVLEALLDTGTLDELLDTCEA